MNCNNCGARMSCGCQKRTASDGKSCCSSCLAFYEKSIETKKPAASIAPTINKNVWGANRYIANK